MKKKRVLFVGSFRNTAKDGSVGGQMYACKSLIGSSLSEEIEWILLDTTNKSVPPPPMFDRVFSAVKRIFKFIYLLLFCNPSSVLVFTANGPSVYEKGIMIIIAKLFRKNTIFAPRGGGLIEELKASDFKRKIFKLVTKYSNYIICQGVFWQKYFNGLLGRDYTQKLVIIPNWIDYQLYQYPKKNFCNKDANSVNILFMGWIQIEKGIHDLFDAILRIKKINKRINVYFLGDGNQRAILQKRAQTENNNTDIHFLFPGWVHGDEKLAFLHRADIFVLPSYAEGMPNSLIEAMATGIASISTNVGAVPDLIEHQVNGIMINPKDINALTDSLNQLLYNVELRDVLAAKAKEKIYRYHSLDSAVASFKRIL